MAFHVPNQYRILRGALASTPADGNNGAFLVRLKYSRRAWVIASDGAGWEHVSVSHPDYTPSWEEMSQVKDLFWDPEDCVIQYHPPSSRYVNNHRHCLHLWRPIGVALPMPEPELVGNPTLGEVPVRI
jgi:hypothetical protein